MFQGLLGYNLLIHILLFDNSTDKLPKEGQRGINLTAIIDFMLKRLLMDSFIMNAIINFTIIFCPDLTRVRIVSNDVERKWHI